MKNILSLILFAIGLSLHLYANGQISDTAEIKRIENNIIGVLQITGEPTKNIAETMRYYKVHGLSIAVIKDFKLLWAKGYGWADDSLKIPVTTKTLFQAASISKSFNAVGILKLAEDKKLDIDADINNYLQSWKLPYDSLSKGKKITIKNLLSHTAGLTVHGFDGYTRNDTLPTLQQILNGQKPANSPAVRSMYEPGIKSEYSGGGITISQMIVTDITHQPYAEYMRKNVLLPLGMTESTFAQPATDVDSSLLASGYDGEGKQVAGRYHIYPEQAAAGLWTNPTELAKFIIEMQLSYLGKSAKVLHQKKTQLMLTPYIDSSAALGVFTFTRNGTKYFGHSGSNAGFVSQYFGSCTGGNGVIVMANADNGPILTEIINSIAAVYKFNDLLLTTVKSIVPVGDSVLKKYIGVYKMSSELSVTFILEGNQLYAQPTGQDKLAVFPEAANKFFTKQLPPADITFTIDDKGKTTGVVFYMHGRKMEMQKIE